MIFLDCPPSLGLLTVNALSAASEVLVPIQCEYFALEGLGQLVTNLRLVQRNINPGLRLNGIVLTMYDGRTKLSEQVAGEIRAHFGPAVYGVTVPRSVRLSEAPSYGMPITRYDPASKGAEAYRSLAAEFLVREPSDAPLAIVAAPPFATPAASAPPSTDREVGSAARAMEIATTTPPDPSGPDSEAPDTRAVGAGEERDAHPVDHGAGDRENRGEAAVGSPTEGEPDAAEPAHPERADAPSAQRSEESPTPTDPVRRRRLRWPFGRSKGGRS